MINIRKLTAVCVVLTAILAVKAYDSTVEAGKDGWIPLFNGKNLDGWKVNDFDAFYAAV